MSDCKTCSQCGKVKAASEFYKNRAKCKKCLSKNEAAYRKANPEKVAAKHAAYRSANPEKLAKLRGHHCAEISCSYISNLVSLPVSSITPELLALKRQQLETHRLSKQIAKALKAKGKPA